MESTSSEGPNESAPVGTGPGERAEAVERVERPEGGAPSASRFALVRFLNTTLGIWFLSAIFISFGGRLYSDYQASQKVRAAAAEKASRNAELIERIDLEIDYRFSNTLSRLFSVDRKFADQHLDASRKAIIDAMNPLVGPGTQDVAPLFPEFRAYNGLALIAELRRHVPPAENLHGLPAATLEAAMMEVSKLAESADEGEMTAKAVATRLATVVALTSNARNEKRWSHGFSYDDCTAANPFC